MRLEELHLEKNKKILFVFHKLSYGGAEKILSFVANRLAERGYKIYVYTYEGTTNYYKFDDRVILIPEYKVCKTKKIRRIVQINQIKKVVKKTNPNLIISFLNTPNLLTILAGLATKTPVIISERGDPYQSKGLVSKLRNHIYKFADGVVFQTYGARDYYGLRIAKKSCVIPNPVTQSISDFSVKKRNEIAFVGRFSIIQKRQDIMLLAFRKVVDIYPDIKLVFYGDGKDEQEVREIVKEMGIEKNVKFEGVVDNIYEKIKYSKMLVLTSDYEGIPNVSIGLPVISTDCSPGGARLLIKNSMNGILVPKGDVDAIANSIIYLLNNEHTANKYGVEAKKSIKEFNPELIFNCWEEYIISNLRL